MKITTLIAGTILTLNSLASFAADEFPEVTVYKSPTCGCCTGWIKHLEESGFEVTSHNVSDVGEYKQKANLPYGMGSCHTAFVGGYAVEGHVPASDIKRMLTEKPAIRGIAVPGMPVGLTGDGVWRSEGCLSGDQLYQRRNQCRLLQALIPRKLTAA